MKKNSESRHLPTGRIDSAYAAGSATASTTTVEPTVAMAECSRYGQAGVAPLKTSRNSASVGLKVNLGGQVSAEASGLNAVRIIHRIGRKKARPATQPSPVQPAMADISRVRLLRLGPGGAVGGAPAAVIAVTLPPRTGRRWRTAVARSWRR